MTYDMSHGSTTTRVSFRVIDNDSQCHIVIVSLTLSGSETESDSTPQVKCDCDFGSSDIDCHSRLATRVIAHVTCLPTKLLVESGQQITLAFLPSGWISVLLLTLGPPTFQIT